MHRKQIKQPTRQDRRPHQPDRQEPGVARHSYFAVSVSGRCCSARSAKRLYCSAMRSSSFRASGVAVIAACLRQSVSSERYDSFRDRSMGMCMQSPPQVHLPGLTSEHFSDDSNVHPRHTWTFVLDRRTTDFSCVPKIQISNNRSSDQKRGQPKNKRGHRLKLLVEGDQHSRMVLS